MSATLGEEGDISNLCRHGWYDWCYYREQSTPTPMQTEMLGRVLGPTKNVANSMSQSILKANGRIVPRRTVRPLLPAELAATNHVEKERRRKFDEAIKQRYGDALSLPDKPVSNFIPYEDDETEPMQMPSDEDPVDSEGRAVGEQSVFDRLIHAELTLPHEESHQFTAMKQCTEYVRGLRYKLRMMGIACNEPTYIFGDNQSVLANTSVPHSVLKKKSNSIAYHFVREGCARDEWRTAYVKTMFNPVDLLTKPLPNGGKRRRFVNMLLYHIYDFDRN